MSCLLKSHKHVLLGKFKLMGLKTGLDMIFICVYSVRMCPLYLTLLPSRRV